MIILKPDLHDAGVDGRGREADGDDLYQFSINCAWLDSISDSQEVKYIALWSRGGAEDVWL